MTCNSLPLVSEACQWEGDDYDDDNDDYGDDYGDNGHDSVGKISVGR